MRPNWITYALIVYGLFVAGILFMVFKASQTPPLLESKDYYQRGLDYQEQINRKSNSVNLKTPLIMQFEPEQKQLKLQFPPGFENITGTIFFYRPNDDLLDRTIAIAPDSANLQVVDMHSFPAGMWKVRVTWEASGTGYYDEIIIRQPY